MNELADALEARAAAFGERLTRESWEDPFWERRFGERGRKYAAEDARHHVRYLVEALRMESPPILEKYVRWLQTVLTTRGMCSRHIAENLERLSRAIADEKLEKGATALELLALGARALRRTEGPAAALDAQAPALAHAVLARLAVNDPGWNAAKGDVAKLVSYLADAMSLNRPEIFANHVRWCAASGLPGLAYARVFEATSAIESELASDRYLSTAAAPMFAAARASAS